MTYTNSLSPRGRQTTTRQEQSPKVMPPYGRSQPTHRSSSYHRSSYIAPPRRHTTTVATTIFALALLGALAAAGWWVTTTFSSYMDSATNTDTPSDNPQSTPRSAWVAGEVPFLYQQDPLWAQASYAGDSFAQSGCGPTCLTMVYVALTGKSDRTPADLGALSEQMGHASSDGTAWAFMSEGVTTLGLLSEELPADEQSIRQALNSGKPVVCSVGPGDFTTTGHFIVLTGVDAQGKLIIRDPNSPERSKTTWDFNQVLKQCLNLWAYSVA